MLPAFMTLEQAAGALNAGALSSEALTRRLLERIERFDPRVRAFVTVTADAALAQARRADDERAQGVVRGPLHGVPVAVKDLVDVAGVRTSCHSEAIDDAVAVRDAAVVARLRTAGAVILGKTGLWEFAYGVPAPDDRIPAPRNPWSLEHSPGGSSSGSGAAVAAGLAFAAIGTDTGGSIRHPSAVCGLVGLKPTFGRVSLRGVMPLSPSLDHVGPMTRTVRDNALMLAAIAGPDPDDPVGRHTPGATDFGGRIGRPLAGLRAGVPVDLIGRAGVEPEVLRAFAVALERLGELGLRPIEFELRCARRVHEDSTVILEHEAWCVHRQRLADPRIAARYGRALRARLERGATHDDEAVARARRSAAQTAREVDAVLVRERFDVLLMPGREAPAMTLAELAVESPVARGRMTRLGNLTGMPALVLPMGFADGPPRLPLSLQVMARRFDEPLIYQVAAAYEASEPWASRHPAWLE